MSLIGFFLIVLGLPSATAGANETPTLISVKIARGVSATLTILPPTNTTNLLGYKYTTNGGSQWKDWSTSASGSYQVMTVDERSTTSSLWGNGQSVSFQVCPVYSPSTFTPGTFGDANLSARNTTATCADNNASPSLSVTGEDGAPSEPTSVSATTGDASLSISFATPADTGSSAITNYEYSLDGGTTWTALSPADTTSPVTIPTLSNGTTYNVNLRAVNGAGSGASSFPVATAAASAAIAISSGSGVTTTYGSSNSGTAFSSTGGAGTISWSVVRTSDSTAVSGISMSGSSISVSNTVPAGTYNMTVTATDSASVPNRSTTTTATVIVNQANLTVIASSPTVTYGDPIPTITRSYTGFVNSETAASSSFTTGLTAPSCTTTYTTSSAAGSSPSTSCSGGSATNYNFNSYTSGSVTVNKANLTAPQVKVSNVGGSTRTILATWSEVEMATSYTVTVINSVNDAKLKVLTGITGTELKITPAVANLPRSGAVTVSVVATGVVGSTNPSASQSAVNSQSSSDLAQRGRLTAKAGRTR